MHTYLYTLIHNAKTPMHMLTHKYTGTQTHKHTNMHTHTHTHTHTHQGFPYASGKWGKPICMYT